MLLKRGLCPAWPAGMAEGCPMLFKRTWVESNSNTKMSFAPGGVVAGSLVQEKSSTLHKAAEKEMVFISG
jgi:hypothetical protein